MKHIVSFTCCLLMAMHSFAQPKALQRPKLVVGIVVDQMRWDYLYRYYSKYGNDGFKRMMNDGFNCQNTMINYLPSFTAPGHTCIYTGSVPAIHGIVANDWLEGDKGMYCTEDPNVKAVSGSYKAGQMSPRNLLTTTVTDELKLATNMQSRVFGISIKDRGSILPAGHLANGAYWFDDSTGNFMSSDYYGKQLPSWLTTFNNKRWADSLINEDWQLLYDRKSYTESLEDNNPYEGSFKGEAMPIFPHSAKGMKGKGYYGLRYLPGGNTIVTKAAKACIKGEALGQGNTTDFLCVSFSTTDYVGHQFTSNSVEVEDMYLRLDMELASLLRYLDKNVGEGAYTVFLTADHGAAHNAKYLQDIKVPGGNETGDTTMARVNAYLKSVTGKDKAVKAMTDYQVYLSDSKASYESHSNKYLKSLAIDWLAKQEGIAYVADLQNINNASVPEPLKTMIVNGYNKDRSGDIQIVLHPGWYSGYAPTGTTHGTWNPYDTHIPLLFYGWGVKPGETYRTTHMTDISATISALLHIQMPNGCVGQVIQEVFEK